jgi:hypothetical protein
MGARFSILVQTGPGAPSSLLYNGYRAFPGGRKRLGRDADPSPLLALRSKKQGRAIPLLSLRAFVACKRVRPTDPTDRPYRPTLPTDPTDRPTNQPTYLPTYRPTYLHSYLPTYLPIKSLTEICRLCVIKYESQMSLVFSFQDCRLRRTLNQIFTNAL